jgi:pimeloyl-ACP methyl ester carboxylesterase
MSCAGSVFYVASGEGEGVFPLLLIHGAGGSRLNWPPELRRLGGATVYTLDLPGHGRSRGASQDTIEGNTA